MPEETLNVLITVMSEGELHVPRLGPVVAAPGFRLVAAMNPFDAVGTARISAAIHDRTCRIAMGYQSASAEARVVERQAPPVPASWRERAVELVRAHPGPPRRPDRVLGARRHRRDPVGVGPGRPARVSTWRTGTSGWTPRSSRCPGASGSPSPRPASRTTSSASCTSGSSARRRPRRRPVTRPAAVMPRGERRPATCGQPRPAEPPARPVPAVGGTCGPRPARRVRRRLAGGRRGGRAGLGGGAGGRRRRDAADARRHGQRDRRAAPRRCAAARGADPARRRARRSGPALGRLEAAAGARRPRWRPRRRPVPGADRRRAGDRSLAGTRRAGRPGLGTPGAGPVPRRRRVRVDDRRAAGRLGARGGGVRLAGARRLRGPQLRAGRAGPPAAHLVRAGRRPWSTTCWPCAGTA